MITIDELNELRKSNETYRIEKISSLVDVDKFCEALCAFSNDFTSSRKNAYILVGVESNGDLSGLRVTDSHIDTLYSIRASNLIHPLPTLSHETFSYDKGDVLVVEVVPSMLTPVKYKNVCYIRIGPLKDRANDGEVTFLTKRSISKNTSFDSLPCIGATINDIDINQMSQYYLSKLNLNPNLDIIQQMTSLRLFHQESGTPTNAAVLLFGKDPCKFIPSEYIEYVKWHSEKNNEIKHREHLFKGNIIQIVSKIDTFIETSIVKAVSNSQTDSPKTNYSATCLEELIVNAVSHRDYSINSPIKLHQFDDRVEISNPGSFYRIVNQDNFLRANDYRNPIIADALKTKYYKHSHSLRDLLENLKIEAYPQAEFITEQDSDLFLVSLKSNEDIALSNSAFTSNLSEDSNLEIGGDFDTILAENILRSIIKDERINLNSEQESRLKQIDFNMGKESVKILMLLKTKDVSKADILKKLGISVQTKNHKTHIQPLLDQKLIDYTIKDKPTSKLQKYKITHLGKAILQYYLQYI